MFWGDLYESNVSKKEARQKNIVEIITGVKGHLIYDKEQIVQYQFKKGDNRIIRNSY